MNATDNYSVIRIQNHILDSYSRRKRACFCPWSILCSKEDQFFKRLDYSIELELYFFWLFTMWHIYLLDMSLSSYLSLDIYSPTCYLCIISSTICLSSIYHLPIYIYLSSISIIHHLSTYHLSIQLPFIWSIIYLCISVYIICSLMYITLETSLILLLKFTI